MHENLRGIREYLIHNIALPGMNMRTVDGSSVVFGHHKQCASTLPKLSECRKEASIGTSDDDEVEATNGCRTCGNSEAGDMVGGGEGVSARLRSPNSVSCFGVRDNRSSCDDATSPSPKHSSSSANIAALYVESSVSIESFKKDKVACCLRCESLDFTSFNKPTAGKADDTNFFHRFGDVARLTCPPSTLRPET